MREVKRNWTRHPEAYDDYGMRAGLEPMQHACH